MVALVVTLDHLLLGGLAELAAQLHWTQEVQDLEAVASLAKSVPCLSAWAPLVHLWQLGHLKPLLTPQALCPSVMYPQLLWGEWLVTPPCPSAMPPQLPWWEELVTLRAPHPSAMPPQLLWGRQLSRPSAMPHQLPWLGQLALMLLLGGMSEVLALPSSFVAEPPAR